MDIGNQIKARRQELNLTQDDLAKKLNVARSTISNWEIGRNYPDIQLIVSISNLLDLPLDILLKEDSNVVKKIAEDTHIRKAQSKKIKVLVAIIVLFILIASFFIYKSQEYKDLSSPNQIKSVSIEENTISIVTDIPFYRSISGYVINNSPDNEDTIEISIFSTIDLTMKNKKETVIDLTNSEEGTSTKNIKKVNFIDGDGIYKSVTL